MECYKKLTGISQEMGRKKNKQKNSKKKKKAWMRGNERSVHTGEPC